MSQAEPRIYERSTIVSFRKTTEEFGGLSNMAPGFPIEIDRIRIRTSEALYQACRFPHMPDVQRMILDEMSPMTAKMRSKPFRDRSREDWEEVRVPVMRWCLRLKLICNWDKFSNLLLATGGRPIVEDSRKDDYWGALASRDETLEGRNVLGRLLMELREKLKADPSGLRSVSPLPIHNFRLCGQELPSMEVEGVAAPRTLGAAQHGAC